jgi:hypothetical protein
LESLKLEIPAMSYDMIWKCMIVTYMVVVNRKCCSVEERRG